ncbi:MAG: hypothetical protein ACK41Y_16450, partial [Paracoccus hibiscisoli]|uniref:hypothetical protein n=1 Tax=Paracoccus hibiscisoli TaxID=2023261 RepID=UPI0039198E5D
MSLLPLPLPLLPHLRSRLLPCPLLMHLWTPGMACVRFVCACARKGAHCGIRRSATMADADADADADA